MEGNRIELKEESLETAAEMAPLCARRFSCLFSDDGCLAEVQHCLEDTVLFVACTSEECPYRVCHGYYGTLCACTVRREIFIRHRR